MKILLTILLCSLLKDSKSQSVIYKGEKSYAATSTWVFENNTGFSEKVYLTIAKLSLKSGFLMLSTNVNFNDHHIAGPIVLYLTNGKVLTVINRVNSDNVDDQSIVLYSLPQAQITPLKQASIRTIRYSIVNNGFKASYTAENKGETKMINISQDIQYEQKVPYNTAIEVAELFSTEGQ